MALIPIPYKLDILVLIITVAWIIYKFSIRNFDYWQKKGISYPKPIPFLGNFLEIFTFRTPIGQYLAKLYNEFQVPYFGIYILNKPHLIIRNPELIKNILVKDFNYFCDRNVLSHEKCDPLFSNMLFALKNPEWKFIRSKMTPVFTSGKLKSMIGLINEAAEDMKLYFEKNVNRDSIEAKEVCAKYTTDVIASCAFGINANSFLYENAQFREIGRKMLANNWHTSIRPTLYFMAHGIAKFLRLSFFVPEVNVFMRQAFWKTIDEREKTKHKRNDLIDIMIEMKSQTTLKEEIKFEGDKVVAQAGQYFAAGFETSSATVSFALYELCIQPKIQNKLRAEIKAVVSKHRGFTFDAIQDMKYLDMVLSETLRKYPVLPFLDRRCMEDYKIPDSDVVIEKGTPVFIPLFGLHYDTIYFPDPEKFDPERFSNENKKNITPFSYIPFGDGPRICIGSRFALLVTKLGIAHILSQYEVEPNAETPIPLVFEAKTFVVASAVGLPMKFRKVSSDAA